MSHMLLLQCFWPVVNRVLPRGQNISWKLPAIPSKQTISEALSATPNRAGFTTNTDLKKEVNTEQVKKRNSKFWPGNLGEADQPPRRPARFVPHKRTCVFTLCSTSPPWLLLLTTYNEYILSDAAVFVVVLSGSAKILGNTESPLFALAEEEASN